MTSKTYLVIDVETTIKNKEIGNNKAFPFYKNNKIVLHGSSLISSTEPEQCSITRNPIFVGPPSSPADILKEATIELLVGHNIKFDLHYLSKEHSFIASLPIRNWLAKHYVWDTQLAEYILSGQSSLFPSLDECSTKYGGTLKDSKIKDMWDADIQTEDIDDDLLQEYLVADLENTNLVFKAQLEAAAKKNMLPLIVTMNSALLGYQEMEYNGMYVDLGICSLHKKREVLKLEAIKKDLMKIIPEPLRKEINLNSTQQLSTLLFGGELKYTELKKIGTFKTGPNAGKDKFRKLPISVINPLFVVKASVEWKTKKRGIYKTGDEVFEELLVTHKGKPVASFIKLLKKFRKVTKEINTYYTPIPKLVCDDNCIHQNINNTATSTGRLSQNNPNLQNVSTGKESMVKSMFTSRWGDEGVIIDADYSQLEIVALAFLSGDPLLKKDIRDGVDVHTRTLNKVKHLLDKKLSSKEQRRQVKAVNFGLIYGGGPATLAKQSGLPIKIVKTVINTFFALYPGVKIWQESLIEEVRRSREAGYGHTKLGFPRSKGTLKSITGREYTFLEFDSPDWVRASKHIDTDFSPTQIKNYPVQGFATGDIVPLVIGALYRRIVGDPTISDYILIINTVHDSILFDVHKSRQLTAKTIITQVMESAPKLIKETFGIDFDLPLKIDISKGRNWKEVE